MLGTNSNVQEITQDDFVTIRDFIHERSGIYFAENKKYIIENRLSKRMGELGIKNYKDYFYQMKYDISQKEFNTLMNLITTNETSFFRNPPQLKSFSEEVIPLLIKEKEQKKQKNLRIWSAGCSTGEEPYTIGIILREKIRDLNSWHMEIFANDISEQVLYTARRGIYSRSTLRSTDKFIIEKYFINEPEGYRISDDIKKLVKFSHMNLTDNRKIKTLSNIDVIFCRNVMIYFSDEVKKNIVRQYYNCLRPGGYLYIGHSESLHGISKAFKLVYFKNALVYKKEGAATTAGTSRIRKPAVVPVGKQIATTGKFTGRTKPTLKTLEEVKKLLASRK